MSTVSNTSWQNTVVDRVSRGMCEDSLQLDRTLSMRIRVLTIPPLSITKVWSSLGNLPSPATVSDLKISLCKQVPALKGLKSHQISLFVDDFELLEQLTIDVVHENDTVQ